MQIWPPDGMAQWSNWAPDSWALGPNCPWSNLPRTHSITMGSVLGPTVQGPFTRTAKFAIKNCKFWHISDARYISVRNRNKLTHLTMLVCRKAASNCFSKLWSRNPPGRRVPRRHWWKMFKREFPGFHLICRQIEHFKGSPGRLISRCHRCQIDQLLSSFNWYNQ